MEICGFKTELPLGVRLAQGGPRVREFEAVKSTWMTRQVLDDENLRTSRPHEWLGRLIATVVGSIGGEPVFAAYEKNSREVPPVVRQLPLVDIGYVLALAHMHTFGPKIEMGLQKCPHCRRGTEYVLNLRQLKVDGSEHANVDEYAVQLPTGWTDPPDPDERLRRPHQGKCWNRFILRPSTIEDAMRNAAYLTRLHMANFEFRIFTDCVLRVESWQTEVTDPDEPPVQTVKLDELEQQAWHMKMNSVIPSLDGRDHQAFFAAERGLPQVRLAIAHSCSNCGGDIATGISFQNFFPKA